MSILVFDTRKGGGVIFASEADVSTPAGASIDQLIAGGVSTITFPAPYTPTLLTINDGASGVSSVSSFTGSGASWGFTCPDLVDETVGPMLGDVSVVITDGVTPLDSIIGVYSKTNYTGVILTSIATGNVGKGFSPALEAGNQEAYDNTIGAISDNGRYVDNPEGAYTGDQIAWDHNVTDKKWRSYVISTIDGKYNPGDSKSFAQKLSGRRIVAKAIKSKKIA